MNFTLPERKILAFLWLEALAKFYFSTFLRSKFHEPIEASVHFQPGDPEHVPLRPDWPPELPECKVIDSKYSKQLEGAYKSFIWEEVHLHA